MAERVFFHVGTPKAGTTYLQTLLWGSRRSLAEAGILLPGEVPFDHNLAAVHFRDATARRAAEVWATMAEQINRHPGTAIVSNEWFSLADADQAAATLGTFEGAEVHVVVTARDLVAVAPAAWQERLKLGRSTTLDTFVDRLGRGRARWTFWTLDPAEVLGRWAGTLPPERVHVITVPVDRRTPHELWRRFAKVVGIPDGAVDLELATPNESLGVESARLLQILGPRLRDAVGASEDKWAAYRWLRRYLSHGLLAPRGGSKIALDPRHHEMLRERSRAAARTIRERGWDVVGDVSELVAGSPAENAVRPEDVGDDQLLVVAADLIVELLRELRTTSDEGRPVPDRAEFVIGEAS